MIDMNLPSLHALPTGFRARAPPLVVEPPQEPAIVAAARAGDVALVRELIADGVDVNEPYEFADAHLPFGGGVPGRAALGVAAYAGHVDVVRALVKAGANVDHVDEGGFTALFIAIFRLETTIALELLAVEDIELESRALLGRTPLILASGQGLIGVVARLIQVGADVAARDDVGRSALNWARALHRVDVAELLKEHGAPE